MSQSAVNANQTGFQALNSATGIWSGRTLTAGTGISITNGSGTAGNPTVAVGPTPASTSWTPVLQFGGASTGITYSRQRGIYQQIGNLVFFDFTIVLTSKGSSTGVATITGLPVVVGASSVDILAPAVNSLLTYSPGYSAVYVDFGLSVGTNTVRLGQSGSVVALTQLTDANFGNTSGFSGTGFYTID